MFSPMAHHGRTRDPAGLSVPKHHCCAIVLWKRPLDVGLWPVLADAITGFTGIWAITLDCSLEGRGGRTVITSGEHALRRRVVSGPHYAPWNACRGSAIARIEIDRVIDGSRLLADLRNIIADTTVRHKGIADAFSYFTGSTRADRVNCSSLIAQGICRQPVSPLARALAEALRQRFTYGDVTPADIARAAAILQLPVNDVPFERIKTIPILPRRTVAGTEGSNRAPISFHS
ncbi:MAG TPA: hypothetical protein VKU01_18635 [Bryobacteraceae bacterium]|nr:hypothetical protein [Bryobacteraceae bacterium]